MDLYKNLIVISIICQCFCQIACLKCFQCNSFENPKCEFLSKNDTNSEFLKDCEDTILGSKTFCRKTTQTIIDDMSVTRIIRSCGWEIFHPNSTHCKNSDTDFKYERSCQCFEDACNTSSKIISLNLVILLMAITSSIF